MAWKSTLNSDFDSDSSSSFGMSFGPVFAAPLPTGAVLSASPAPSWITGLSDAALRADFTTFASSGALTEAEMTKALTDLASELSSAHATLSTGQLADLKTIASNTGSMGASSYLQYIVNAFVDGNAANAYWTGGGASSVALGNLAVGYSVTKLDELIGKWFQGTDLPQDTVSMSGSKPFTISYSAVSAPLYGSSGPTMADINQGDLGDCYLLGSLAEVANQDAALIESMITNNGNNTYGVRFYVNGVATYVTVDNQLADGGAVFNHDANLWASLVEQAYAQAQASGVTCGGGYGDANSFSSIGNGGAPEFALEEITGASAITDFYSIGSSWYKEVYNQSFTSGAGTSGVSTTSALSTLAADLLVGSDVVLSSYTSAKDSSGKTTLVADHCMSVYGYDATTGLLEIRNPWGVASGQSWDTTFEVGLSTLLADGDTVTADNAGTATTVSGASVMAAAGLQSMSQVKSFSFSDTVAHVDSGLSGLIADSKLTSLTVSGTSGADALTLTGLKAAATINMGGDSDSASVTGFKSTGSGVGSATGLAFGSSGYDAIALGSGATTVDYALGASSGVETISSFNAAHDLLSINLNGATLEQTFVGGGDWLSSSADLSHGVFLAGVTTLQTVTTTGGVAAVA